MPNRIFRPPTALICMGLVCNKRVHTKKLSKSHLVKHFSSMHIWFDIWIIQIILDTNVLQLYKTTVLFLTASISRRTLDLVIFHFSTKVQIYNILVSPKFTTHIRKPLKLMYLKRFWTGIVLGIVIVLTFASIFIA